MPTAPIRRLAFALAFLAAAPALAQPARLAAASPTAATDTVTARPLDGGKMWLFEEPPTAYLAATYGFRQWIKFRFHQKLDCTTQYQFCFKSRWIVFGDDFINNLINLINSLFFFRKRL